MDTTKTWRSRVFSLLVDTGAPDWGRVAVSTLLFSAITVSAFVTMMETVPSVRAEIVHLYEVIQFGIAALFTVEYALRLWTAPELDPRIAPVRLRMRYADSFLGVIDLLIIVPAWVGLFVEIGRAHV